jgi:branched-chain amino acid transport system permease protein
LLFVAGCGVDGEQRRACERLIPAFDPRAELATIHRVEPETIGQQGLRITYRTRDPAGRVVERWIACGFAGGSFGPGRLKVTAIATDKDGDLSDIQLRMLEIWLRVTDPRRQPLDFDPDLTFGPSVADPLYALQQVINALVPGCLYALIAIGFSLVYGIIGRINLAFGDMATLAAAISFTGIVLLGNLGLGLAPLAIAVIVWSALGFAAAWGLLSERLIFRPLQGLSTQAPLIATIGLAIALREVLRLAQGSKEAWLHPIDLKAMTIVATPLYAISISPMQILIAAVTLSLALGLALLVGNSPFGRRYRACCDDLVAARLMGVDVDRTVALTFAVGAASAGAAGVLILLYYGTVGAYMGLAFGFKALAAAIVGGLGSVPGAILGGVLVGLIEGFWSGYLAMAYRDLAIFGLLAATLIFRSNGLLGRRHDRTA